jgi:mRNA interferase YafO
MDIRVFVSEEVKASSSQPVLKKIVDEFKLYKSGQGRPAHFGRDVPYDFPFSVRESGLAHVHLKDSTSKNWHLKKVSFSKTSNTALIYCQGAVQKNCYFLISILENAHETYRVKPLYLEYLAERAEVFREKF